VTGEFSRDFGGELMAERGGFEPPVLFGHSRFPGVRVKPLCHLSKPLNYLHLRKSATFII
jgi:hypothetical protein